MGKRGGPEHRMYTSSGYHYLNSGRNPCVSVLLDMNFNGFYWLGEANVCVDISAAAGKYFKAQLATLNSEFIHEVRGKGLMIAVELTSEADGARQYCEALKTRGILCKHTQGSDSNALT